MENPTEGGIPYSRIDLLCFHVLTINSEGNRETFQLLKDKVEGAEGEEVESWKKWEHFPQLREETNYGSPRVLQFFAWLIHNFVAAHAIDKSGREEYLKVLRQCNSLTWFTADDFAFAFLTVQSGGNKWLRCHRLLLQKRLDEPDFKGDDLPKSEMKDVKGAEYCSKKMGISSEEAQTRFRAIVKLYYMNYVDETKPGVRDNKLALYNAVQCLADAEQDRIDIRRAAESEAAVADSPVAAGRTLNSVVPVPAVPVDQEYNDIYDSQLCALQGFGAV